MQNVRAPLYAACRRARVLRALSVFPAAACAFACAFGVAGRAAAAPRDFVELSWDAETACSSSGDVLDAIDQQLGAAFASEIRLTARGAVRASENGEYELDLEYTTTGGARETRRIRGESCAAVTSAASLVLALALDPEHSVVMPREPTPVTPPIAAEPKRPSDSAFGVGLLAVLDTPIHDQPAYGGGLRFAYRYSAFELSATAHLFLPRDSARGDITLRLQLWSVDVGACYLFRLSEWAVGPCARFELGRLSGAPRGEVDAPTAGAARTQAATLGAALRVPLWAALQLWLDAGVEWVSRRPQFEVTGEGTVASPSEFGARLVFGPVLVF